METHNYVHIPVLLSEVIHYLSLQPGQSAVDATLGGGGYSKAILEEIGPKGKLLSIDLDSAAIEYVKLQNSDINAGNWILAQGNFAHIERIVKNHQFHSPDAIVADLGLSSFELDQAGRGMSFQKKEVLDMRFDLHGNTTDAKYILNTYTLQQLTTIFRSYSEEKFSSQIARKILEKRQEAHIKFTTDLYDIIEQALPKPLKHKAADSARRIFQALRITVNHELDNLQEFLPKAFDLLNPGGRLVVVSFHSLEDRIVKHFIAGMAKGCVCPPDFPQCICGKNARGKLLTKKIITASEQELAENPRSKSAKLRAVIKL